MNRNHGYTTIIPMIKDGVATTTITVVKISRQQFEDTRNRVATMYGRDVSAGSSDLISINFSEPVDSSSFIVSVVCPESMWNLVTGTVSQVCEEIAAQHDSPIKRVLTNIGDAAEVVQKLAKDFAEIAGTIQQARKQGIERKAAEEASKQVQK